MANTNKLCVSDNDLQKRFLVVQRFLRPICKQQEHGPQVKFAQNTSTCYNIAALDGAQLTNNYKDWRFRTCTTNFLAMYHETWNRSEENVRCWYLFRAYLHLYKFDRIANQEEEFMCLHCDPAEKVTATHSMYRRGPHLHICQAPQPIPHFHLALHCGRLDWVMGSLDSFTLAMEHAVQMFRDEVLLPLEDHFSRKGA